ncbi:hypothetical protein WCT87_07055 [Pectobacterium brasiliense]|uniref:hypothetical protein n=1 Tax=Pectobacterium brasiliense TaxID=180957 RepID=UPI0030187C9A
MFTNINAAVEEARFMRAITGHCHGVIQRQKGVMLVRKIDRRGMHTLYTTQQDKFGTVNTEGDA